MDAPTSDVGAKELVLGFLRQPYLRRPKATRGTQESVSSNSQHPPNQATPSESSCSAPSAK
jgi:hypothetical protein